MVIHLRDKITNIAEAVVYTGDLVGRNIAGFHEEGIKEFLYRRWCAVAGGGEGCHQLGEGGDGELECGLATGEDLAGVSVGDEV